MLNTSSHYVAPEILDYIDFFKHIKEGHLTKYVYYKDQNNVDWLQALIRNKLYYVFYKDIELLNSIIGLRITQLNLPQNVFEIGVGCEESVRLKSVTFLKAIGARKYTAIDIFEPYARDAITFINQGLDIATDYIVCDAFHHLSLKSNATPKTVLLLGGTLANFSDFDMHGFFTQLSNALAPNDYFVTTVDTCTNLNSLHEAYNNIYLKQLALNCLRHFNTNLANRQRLDIKQFAPRFDWNSNTNTVELSLISKTDQTLTIANTQIAISKGEKFVAIHSRKNDISNISSIASQHNFNLTDTLSVDGNPMKMLCFKRI